MFVQKDTDTLWEAYVKNKEASSILGEIETCNKDPRARVLRIEIRELHNKARRKMEALKQFINKKDKRFKINRQTQTEKINEYNKIFN